MRRIVCWVICIVMVTVLFVGCGTTGTNAPAESNAKSETKASEAKNESPAAQEITIDFTHHRSEDVDVYNKIIAMFEKDNPGIKVEMNATTANQEEFYAMVKTKISGDELDVLTIQPGVWMDAFVQDGKLMDLTDQPFVKNYNTSITKAAVTNGKLYGLSQSYNAYLIFYNKNIFKKYNLSAPKTWAEMQHVAKVLRENGEDTIAVGFSENWVFDLIGCPLFSSYFADNQKAMYDLQEGIIKWNDPTIKSILQDIQNMRKDNFFIKGAEGTTYENSIALFAQGKAAMLNTGTWSIGFMKSQAPDIELGFFLLPDSKGNIVMSNDVGTAICISAGTKHPAEALKFVEYLSSPEIAKIYSDETQQFSPIIGIESNTPELNEVAQMMQDYKSERAGTCFITDAKFLEIIRNSWSRAFLGDDIDKIIEESQAQTDAL